MQTPEVGAVHQAIQRTWRAECARIVAVVARLTRDVGLAEECAQDALVAALEHWPRDGVPDRPGAWLTTAARHKALDHLRRAQRMAREHEALGHDLDAQQALTVPDIADGIDARRDDDIGDDLLRLIFIACHPLLSTDARVALTLRLLGGLGTAEIARAFLVPEPTVAQRIVRAKRTLAEARVPFALPHGADRAARLGSVMAVVYLIFNEGYAASAGDDWMRPALCQEALRLAGLLSGLLPVDPEVFGLEALLALQASRAAARVDARGEPVLLAEQDRGRWDAALIARGLGALARAEALCTAAALPLGAYALQAAIAACHARAARAEATDWVRIVALYDALAQAQPTPVVALNRAVAVAMVEGPAAGLAIVDTLRADPRLARYPWLPAARGELLARLGRRSEASAAFLQAAALADNGRDKALLLARAGQPSAPE